VLKGDYRRESERARERESERARERESERERERECACAYVQGYCRNWVPLCVPHSNLFEPKASRYWNANRLVFDCLVCIRGVNPRDCRLYLFWYGLLVIPKSVLSSVSGSQNPLASSSSSSSSFSSPSSVWLQFPHLSQFPRPAQPARFSRHSQLLDSHHQHTNRPRFPRSPPRHYS